VLHVRRPSATLIIALLALFVALGGPAQARKLINGADIRKGTVRSAQVKDRSLTERDLSTAAVRALQSTPDGTITASKLAPGAVSGAAIADGTVTPVDIAEGAIGAGKLADNSVTGAKIADGTLTTNDIARFSGAFRIAAEDLGAIQPHTCWARSPRGLAPEVGGADISQDALLVHPRATFNENVLSFSYRTSGPESPSRFVLSLCNVTDSPYTPPSIGFSYVVFDLP
jgi:hypothetical protein